MHFNNILDPHLISTLAHVQWMTVTLFSDSFSVVGENNNKKQSEYYSLVSNITASNCSCKSFSLSSKLKRKTTKKIWQKTDI